MTESEKALRAIFARPRTDDELLAVMSHGYEDNLQAIVLEAIGFIEQLIGTDANVFETMLRHMIVVEHAKLLWRANLSDGLEVEQQRVIAAIQHIAQNAAQAIDVSINADDETLLAMLRHTEPSGSG